MTSKAVVESKFKTGKALHPPPLEPASIHSTDDEFSRAHGGSDRAAENVHDSGSDSVSTVSESSATTSDGSMDSEDNSEPQASASRAESATRMDDAHDYDNDYADNNGRVNANEIHDSTGLLERLNAFLPDMKKANEELVARQKANGSTESGFEIIDMSDNSTVNDNERDDEQDEDSNSDGSETNYDNQVSSNIPADGSVPTPSQQGKRKRGPYIEMDLNLGVLEEQPEDADAEGGERSRIFDGIRLPTHGNRQPSLRSTSWSDGRGSSRGAVDADDAGIGADKNFGIDALQKRKRSKKDSDNLKIVEVPDGS